MYVRRTFIYIFIKIDKYICFLPIKCFDYIFIHKVFKDGCTTVPISTANIGIG